jgi:hypothetical protein
VPFRSLGACGRISSGKGGSSLKISWREGQKGDCQDEWVIFEVADRKLQSRDQHQALGRGARLLEEKFVHEEAHFD